MGTTCMGCLLSKPERTVSPISQSRLQSFSPLQEINPNAYSSTLSPAQAVQDLVDVAVDELRYAVSQFSNSHLASDVTSNLTPVALDALQRDPGLVKVLEKNCWCAAIGMFTGPINIQKLRADLNDYADGKL